MSMDDANRASPSYWLDACEDISCDFIDFDVSSIVSDQPDNASNQDFFGGIDRILDSIKNGAGLPLEPQPEPQPQPNATADASKLQLQQSFTPPDNGLPLDIPHSGAHTNGNAEGVLVSYSQESNRGSHVRENNGDERCGKRARFGGYNNERPYYGRMNYQPRERESERCFNNRKRPRDRDEDGARKREHYGSSRRDVREQKGYWERERGSAQLVFRMGTWEADRIRQDNKIANDAKKETNGKLDNKSEETKEKVPEEKARQYQLDVLQQAKEKNTIAFLETGAGKTLIAVLLMKSIQETLQQQNRKMLAVFLVPKVPLVYQVISFLTIYYLSLDAFVHLRNTVVYNFM